MADNLFKTTKHGIRNFFHMLGCARLPYLWIIVYIVSCFALTNVGISATEYTARLFAGEVGFLPVILPYLIVTLISFLVGSISGLLCLFCEARIDRNIRRVIWKKIVCLPFGYYDNGNPKELISRITTDTSTVSALIMTVFVTLITDAYSLFALLRKIGSYDTKLMVILILSLPLNIFIAIFLGRMDFGISDIVNRKNAEMTEQVAETTENSLLVKAMSQEEKELGRNMERVTGVYRKSILNTWITAIGNPAYTFANLVQLIVIILVGRRFYSDGTLSLAQWIAYFAFAQSIVTYIAGYCGNWQSFKNAQGATNRVSALLTEPEEDRTSGSPVSTLKGAVKFEHVDFAYGDKQVFHDISFTIPEGKITAVIGPSGSGKTTVFNLIERFYAPQQGTISIGEDPISGFSLKEYRNKLGYITQETTLFSGTVRENLLFGIERDVPEDEIISACEKAGILEFLREDPLFLDLAVGEGGMNLSGGQKQRIAIAQMLLKKPDYLLMDEATSAIDITGKDLVFDSIREVMQGRTILLIAHDLQTVQKADHLIILENGVITGQGSPAELSGHSFMREFMGKEARHA